MKQEIKQRIERINLGEVPEGYKKLAISNGQLAIIPEEWEVKKVSEVSNIIGGGTPKTDCESYWDGEIPWISINDFKGENRYIHETEKNITDKGLKESSTKLLNAGDIIISARGTVGELGQLTRCMAFNQSCFGIVANNKMSSDFLYFGLKMNLFQLHSKKGGAVFDTIIKNTFDELFIFLPPLSEQEKIAEILSVWDKAIELKEQYIKELKKRKKGLMQKLLAGKVRLPGFKDEWQSKSLNVIFKEKNERVNNREIKPVAVGVQGIRQRDEIFSKELSTDYSKNKVLNQNQICFGMGTNEIVYDVLLYDKVYCVSPAYKVFEIIGSNPYFIKLLLDINKVRLSRIYMIISARQGKSVDFEGLFNEKFKIPSLPEQIAIANVLSLADLEISLQKAELETLKLQKKGLMQVLLTGKVRTN